MHMILMNIYLETNDYYRMRVHHLIERKGVIQFESILNELFVWKTYNNYNGSKDEVFICNTLNNDKRKYA